MREREGSGTDLIKQCSTQYFKEVTGIHAGRNTNIVGKAAAIWASFLLFPVAFPLTLRGLGYAQEESTSRIRGFAATAGGFVADMGIWFILTRVNPTDFYTNKALSIPASHAMVDAIRLGALGLHHIRTQDRSANTLVP